MSIIKNPVEAIKEKIKNQESYSEFQKLDQCTKIIALKGNRHIEYAIRDEKNKTLRFFKEVPYINKTDWLVDERENKYYVSNVLIDQPFSFKTETEKRTIKTTVIEYTEEIDGESLIEELRLNMNAASKQEINVTFDHVTNSTISDIGKAISNISQSQDVKMMWRKLRHDLDYRFDYEKSTKLIKNVDDAFENKDGTKFDEDLFKKRANAIGGAIGTAMGQMLVILLDYFSKNNI